MAPRIHTGIPGRWDGARCRQLRIARPEDDLPFLPEHQDLMLDFCNQPQPCPARHRCLLFALVNNYQLGVWGGMSPEDRAALRKTHPLPAGRPTGTGVVYDPPLQWVWMPPGEALQMHLDTRKQQRQKMGINNDKGSKTCRPDERTG